MIKQECQDRSGYKYAKFLLQDKQRELQSLELKHSRKLIPSGTTPSPCGNPSGRVLPASTMA